MKYVQNFTVARADGINDEIRKINIFWILTSWNSFANMFGGVWKTFWNHIHNVTDEWTRSIYFVNFYALSNQSKQSNLSSYQRFLQNEGVVRTQSLMFIIRLIGHDQWQKIITEYFSKSFDCLAITMVSNKLLHYNGLTYSWSSRYTLRIYNKECGVILHEHWFHRRHKKTSIFKEFPSVWSWVNMKHIVCIYTRREPSLKNSRKRNAIWVCNYQVSNWKRDCFELIWLPSYHWKKNQTRHQWFTTSVCFVNVTSLISSQSVYIYTLHNKHGYSGGLSLWMIKMFSYNHCRTN